MESDFPEETEPTLRASNTAARKQKFIDCYSDCGGTITDACEKAGISRETFYTWRREDKSFAGSLAEVESHLNERVEDVLMHLILIDHDPASVRYFLDRRHPKYMARMHVRQEVAHTKTLEVLLREEALRKIEAATARSSSSV